MTEFTPGPWRCKVTGDHKTIYIEDGLVEKYDIPIAEIDIDDVIGDDRIVAQKNAHLITAAPDLYVELWNTVQLLTDIVEGRDWGAIEEYICSAQTALAKARGE